jgi:hypothetical protein
MDEGAAVAGRSSNPGSVPWVEAGGSVNAGAHTGTITGQSGSCTWTWGDPGSLPIQLGSFSASEVSAGFIRLEWLTLSETNNNGFYVERKKESSGAYSTVSGLIPGSGTTLERHLYAWTDSADGPGKYFYRLRQVNLDGRESISYEIMVEVTGVLAVGGKTALPEEFALPQNHPNPFNPSTTIRYDLPNESRVSLRIYNLLGEQVASLSDGVEQAGSRSKVWDAGAFPSGIYFCRLCAVSTVDAGRSFTQVRRMLLVR